mgnify:CR=1 FL=1
MNSLMGARVTVRAGARYGGRGFSRGAFVPKYLVGSIGTIDKIQKGTDGTECHLLELQCWVPAKYLCFPEQHDYVKPPPHKKHGMSGSRIYRIFRSMHNRCETPSCTVYRYYGGRGITVCSEWDDFTVFYQWAISNGYADNLSIDRIDNDKGYSPENCRWVTQSEQVKNRRPFKRNKTIISQDSNKNKK